MTCVHLQKLYQVCQENELKFSASDLLNIVCKQCQKQEVCPSVLFEEYEATHEIDNETPATQEVNGNSQ